MRLNPHFDPRRHLGIQDALPAAPPGTAPAPSLPRVTYVRPFVHWLRVEAGDLLRCLRLPAGRLRAASWSRIRSTRAWAARSILPILSALWLRFGFAPTAACALALLTYFGAAMLGDSNPAGVALATGKWALVLALAAGMVILARKQVRRAVRW